MATRGSIIECVEKSLENYRLGEVRREEDRVTVKAEVKGKEKCPYCGSGRLYRHGESKPRKVLHTWSNGRRVYLELHRRHWKCCSCRHTFTEGWQLVRPRSRLIRPSEDEALWQLKDRSFSQVTRELGIGYGTLRRTLEREIDEETLGFIEDKDELYLGIDEHSFSHQELVHTITEVKRRKVIAILKDDRMATLKRFLGKVPPDKVKEVCIDMKDGLRKVAEEVFPLARVGLDPFHVIADSGGRMDEARRIEQDAYQKSKVHLPKKIFLVGREKLIPEKKQRVDALLEKYPNLKTFYWAKERVRELYQKPDREEATKPLENIILNLKSSGEPS
jgi:transposase